MVYLRDIATSIAIYGFFGFVWFGWALEGPKESWKKYIGLACAASVLVGLFGVYLIFTFQEEASALSQTSLSTWYYAIVIAEFSLGGILAFVLYKKKKPEYIAPLICLIVGLHFSPLAFVFQDHTMHILTILFVAVSTLTIRRINSISYAASALTGIGAGSTLLCFALFNIIRLLLF